MFLTANITLKPIATAAMNTATRTSAIAFLMYFIKTPYAAGQICGGKSYTATLTISAPRARNLYSNMP